MPRVNTIEDIWSYIAVTHQDQCWLWKKSTSDKRGYGQTYFNGKHIRSHRLIFQLMNGYLPPVVMHTCDNPSCCNPNHLVAGTYDMNNKDRAKKGRSNNVCGEDHYKNKLTKSDVLEIRKLCANNVSQRKIAEQYSISQGHVKDINLRKKWKWLADE